MICDLGCLNLECSAKGTLKGTDFSEGRWSALSENQGPFKVSQVGYEKLKHQNQ